MRSFHYPPQALRESYWLGAVGTLGAAALLVLARPAPSLAWLIGAVGLLFLVYFARTVVRQYTRIEVDTSGIGARGPLGVAIPWDDVRAARLNYYSTRPDRSGGWMELVIRGRGRSIRIESTLADFAACVAEVVRELRSREVALDERTRNNLRALDIHI